MSNGIDNNETSLKTLENLKGSVDNRVRAIYNQAYKKGYEDKAEEQKKPAHDGCVGCEYLSKNTTEYPCNQCVNNYLNMWCKRKEVREMTKEEAIDIIVGVISTDSEAENEALDLAIEALKEPTTVHCKDCKHRCENGECELDTGYPYAYGREAWDDNWFCADGERKEQEE